MAVQVKKSSVITTRDLFPSNKNNSAFEDGSIREAVGTIEVDNGDSIGSTYLMSQVPSNARISQIILDSDDIGTTAAADFGLHQTTQNGGAVVDADIFSAAKSLSGGAISNENILHDSGTYGIENVEKPLWDMLGLDKDPGVFYDLVATLTTASDAVGTLTTKLRYLI